AAEDHHDGVRFATGRNEESAREALFLCIFAGVANLRAGCQPAPFELARCNCLAGDFGGQRYGIRRRAVFAKCRSTSMRGSFELHGPEKAHGVTAAISSAQGFLACDVDGTRGV